MEVKKKRVDNFLETNGFLQCIGDIDGTHIEVKEPNDHYSDYINRKGYYAACNYRHCF